MDNKVKRRLEVFSQHLYGSFSCETLTDGGCIWLEDMKDFLDGPYRFYRQEVKDYTIHRVDSSRFFGIVILL
jgi:hypothetical protein